MTFYYLVTVCFLRILFRILYGHAIEGRKNWDVRGPLIVAPNHQNLLDPFLVGTAVPEEICYLAKQEIFSWPILGFLARKYNSVPTKRSGFDLEAFRAAGRILRGGKPLLIFPEGTRSSNGELLPPKRGVGLIAYQNEADVLPVYVHGSLNLWQAFIRSPKVTVRFGEIIRIAKYQAMDRPQKEKYALISEDIMKAITILRDSAAQKAEKP